MSMHSDLLLRVALILLGLMVIGDILLYHLVSRPMLARLAELEALEEDTPQ